MDESIREPEERYAMLIEALTGEPGVTLGAGKKGFGSSALCISGKIFAMLSSRGRFVVKLPRQRVDSMVAAGEGQRFDLGHGRVMKEWLEITTAEEEWLPLAREAMRFVGAKHTA